MIWMGDDEMDDIHLSAGAISLCNPYLFRPSCFKNAAKFPKSGLHHFAIGCVLHVTEIIHFLLDLFFEFDFTTSVLENL